MRLTCVHHENLFYITRVISYSWNILRIYIKVDTCDWSGTF
jgi:hypothetical protein